MESFFKNAASIDLALIVPVTSLKAKELVQQGSREVYQLNDDGTKLTINTQTEIRKGVLYGYAIF
jgi:hypothetical protein